MKHIRIRRWLLALETGMPTFWLPRVGRTFVSIRGTKFDGWSFGIGPWIFTAGRER